MSVYTTADEHRDAAIEQITQATKSLSEIIIGRCWGWDEYTRIYHAKLQKALNDLVEIRRDLE